MGIPGLWDILRPAGKSRSLTHLTVVDGFEDNRSGKRAYRIGIDASIWFFHANGGQGGENPELRTLYFRCCRLLALPVLPLFVFDGPLRPSQKRGRRIGKNEHWMVSGMREIIDAFGFEYWTAPGEAEAELAYLNDIGVIDAILSDDVDNFLFGAKVVIRNPSATLTGTQTHVRKTGQGEKDDGQNVVIYRSTDIEQHPDVSLKRGGLILIGLMSGGDYNTSGLMNIGMKIAYALARCGYGDELIDTLEQLQDRKEHLPSALNGWREAVRRDLSGESDVTDLLKRKYPSKAKAITDDFPVIEDICCYAAPITSFTKNRDVSDIQWKKKASLAKLAGVCERHFEWGVMDTIIKRFRTTVWQGAVLRALIEAVLKRDERSTKATHPTATPKKATSRQEPVTAGTRLATAFLELDVNSPPRPSQSRKPTSEEASCSKNDTARKDVKTIADINLDSLVLRIHSSRRHPSTDNMLEYRLEIDPAQLVEQAKAGVRGDRIPPDSVLDGDFVDPESEVGDRNPKRPPPDPLSTLRVWMPGPIVQLACPELVKEFEAVEQGKAAKKAAKGTKKKAGTAPDAALITEWLQPVDVAVAVPPPKRAATSVKKSKSSQEDPPNRLLFPASKPSLKSTSKVRSHTAQIGPLHDVPDPFLDSGTASNPSGAHGPPRAPSDPFSYLSKPAKPTLPPPARARSNPIDKSKRPVSLQSSDSDDRSRSPRTARTAKTQSSPRKLIIPSDTSDDDDLPADAYLSLLSPTKKPSLVSTASARTKGARLPPPAEEVIVLSSDDETPRAPRMMTAARIAKEPRVPVEQKSMASLSSSVIEVIDLT